MCSFVLTKIHKEVIENNSGAPKPQAPNTLNRLPKIKISKNAERTDKIGLDTWILVMTYTMGFASIHSFYPNMSKFLQQNYGYSNADAGHLSSIPYVVASFTVPMFGNLLTWLGEKYFERCFELAMFMICLAHVLFLVF